MERGDGGRPPNFLLMGAVCGGLGIAAGAFGAHALKPLLTAEMHMVFETAVRYQLYHALALLLTGVLLERAAPSNGAQLLRSAGLLFLAGMLLFSGSLYLLALSGVRWLGAITPVGGLCLLAGWGLLAWGAQVNSKQ